MVEALGANRVMLGTELPANVKIQGESARALALSNEGEAMVTEGTAAEVYELEL